MELYDCEEIDNSVSPFVGFIDKLLDREWKFIGILPPKKKSLPPNLLPKFIGTPPTIWIKSGENLKSPLLGAISEVFVSHDEIV